MFRAISKLAAASFVVAPIYFSDHQTGDFKTGLPNYTRAQVAQHKTSETGIWFTYRDGVYDLTNFVPQHPGSNEGLMMVAGGAIDPVWFVLRIHYRDHVLGLLEQFRIGNLDPSEQKLEMVDPFEFEPKRSNIGQVLSEKPFNCETNPSKLYGSFLTPNEQFYKRNHFYVPDIDPNTYTLEIVLGDDKCFSFNLKDLEEKFEQVEVTASVQCAGNRRKTMTAYGMTKGLPWSTGAIGNAVWTGYRLKDILEYCGIKDDAQYKHIIADGHDHYLDFNFGNSIPIEKALDQYGDVIVAVKMNGQPLPRDHGFPVRLVVPGYIGVRWVKWLKRITLSQNESDNFWHQRDYKIFLPTDDMNDLEVRKRTLALYEAPVSSAIGTPLEGAQYDAKNPEIELKGYAMCGGGRGISRVELTTDGGETWIQANKEAQPQSYNKNWSWTLWNATIPHENTNQVCVRAFDSNYNTQPKSSDDIWNPRGLLNNSWHCINLRPKSQNGQISHPNASLLRPLLLT